MSSSDRSLDRPRPLVLVVEDDVEVNLAIRTSLATEFATIAASNGHQGLALALAHVPDLIVTDLIMPKMGGDEFFRQARRTPSLSEVPFVLLTGNSDRELRARLLREGANDYLLKPFSPDELLARIQNLIAAKQAERLRSENAVLTEQVRLESLFLRTLSHELRTPLNSIIGFTQVMYTGRAGPISDEHKEYLGEVLSSSDRLLRLIETVLELVSLEAGKIELHPEAVDLTALVEQVRHGLVPSATRSFSIMTTVDDRLGLVIADPARIRQVLYNFLSNALKFSPEDSPIWIRLLPEGSNSLRIEVEDRGPGIAPGDLDRLFLEFQQLHLSDPTRHEGSGLGLAVTKKMVEAMGGSVGVRSEPGAGSLFFAIVPASAAPLA